MKKKEWHPFMVISGYLKTPSIRHSRPDMSGTGKKQFNSYWNGNDTYQTLFTNLIDAEIFLEFLVKDGPPYYIMVDDLTEEDVRKIVEDGRNKKLDSAIRASLSNKPIEKQLRLNLRH